MSSPTVSMHRALASARNGYKPSDDKGVDSPNPHTAAIARVSMPKAPTGPEPTPPKVQKVDLGRTDEKNSMTFMNDSSSNPSGAKGVNGVIQDLTGKN